MECEEFDSGDFETLSVIVLCSDKVVSPVCSRSRDSSSNFTALNVFKSSSVCIITVVKRTNAWYCSSSLVKNTLGIIITCTTNTFLFCWHS